MPAPIIAAVLGRLAASVVARAAASRAAASAAGAATRSAGKKGMADIFGHLAKNQAGASTRINLGNTSSLTPQKLAQFNPRAAAAQAAQQQLPGLKGPSWVQQAMQLAGNPGGQQPPAARQQVSTTAAASGKNFGSMLSGNGPPPDDDDPSKAGKGDAASLTDLGKSLGSGAIKSAMFGPAGLIAGFFGVSFAAKTFSEKLYDGNRALAKYNGAIGAAYAKQTFKDVQRARGAAGAQSGSAAALAGAVGESRDAWQPFNNSMANIKNSIGVGGAKLWGFLGKGMSKLSGILDWLNWYRSVVVDQKDRGPAANWVNQMAADYRKEFQGKRRRQRTPGETHD